MEAVKAIQFPGLQEQIYNVLQNEGAANTKELSKRFRVPERNIRAAVEDLRMEHIIINDQDGRGYYLSDAPAVVQRYYWQEYSRAMSILKRLKPVRAFLKEHGITNLRQEEKRNVKVLGK